MLAQVCSCEPQYSIALRNSLSLSSMCSLVNTPVLDIGSDWAENQSSSAFVASGRCRSSQRHSHSGLEGFSARMKLSSALTAALNSDQKNGKTESLTKTSPTKPGISSNLRSTAFPCLFQDDASTEDAFEVELDLQKLTLGQDSGLGRLHRKIVDEPMDESQRWEKLGSAQLVSRFMSPGSLGTSLAASLPKPMAAGARKAAGLDSPSPSPHISSFKDILPEQLGARSAEGRRLRRRVLRGTVLVCIVAGYHGKRFIYERAKELGVRLIIVDAADSWGRGLADEQIISKFIPIDFSDEAAVFDKCLAAIKQVDKEFGQVDGVISFWELSQPLVARLAERLGLPGNPPDAVDNARDKQRTRDVMQAAGLPTPRNMSVATPADLQEAARRVGFPAVLKPTSGAASLGVVKVDSLDDLDRIYRRVCKEVASITESADGRWETNVDEDDNVIFEANTGARYVAQTFIMEQYLDGPEVDVDLAFSGGEAVYGAVTDNWPTVEPYFNETGSNTPSILPIEQQRALADLAVSAAKALGFQMGVLHTELKYTSHGPHLIEVNARMGGGPVRLMNQLVWGVDLVEEQLLASAGIPSRPYLSRRPDKYVAEYSVNAKRTGILKHVDFLQGWQDKEDVVYCRPLVHPGEKVVAIEDGMPTWLYEVLVTRASMEEAIDYVKSIELAIEPLIEIEPRRSQKTPDAAP